MARARLGFAFTLLLGPLWAGAALAADVIANPTYPDAAIDRPLLRGVFGMRVRAWPDGRPVRVFVLPDDNPVHQDFTKSALRMYPYQLRQNWDRLLYSGTGQPPIVVNSEDEMLRRVTETPGAIGYVSTFHPPAAPAPKPARGKAPAPSAAPVAPTVKVLHVQ